MRKQRIITTLICATLLFAQAQFSAQAADGDNPAPAATKTAKNVDVELEKSRSLIASSCCRFRSIHSLNIKINFSKGWGRKREKKYER